MQKSGDPEDVTSWQLASAQVEHHGPWSGVHRGHDGSRLVHEHVDMIPGCSHRWRRGEGPSEFG